MQNVFIMVSVTEQKEFVCLAPAEPNTKHGKLQWRKFSCFIMNGDTQENGKLIKVGPS